MRRHKTGVLGLLAMLLLSTLLGLVPVQAEVRILGNPVDRYGRLLDGTELDAMAEADLSAKATASSSFFLPPQLIPNPTGYEAESVAVGYMAGGEKYVAAAFDRNPVNGQGSRLVRINANQTTTHIADFGIGRPEALAVSDLDGFLDSPDIVVGFADGPSGAVLMGRKGLTPETIITGDGPHAAVHIQGITHDNVVLSNWRADVGTIVGSNDLSQVATAPLAMVRAGYNRLSAGNVCPNSNAPAHDLIYMPGQGYAMPATVLYCNGGHGQFTQGQVLARPNQNELFTSLGVGDLNGDGRDDLVFANGRNRPAGALYIYYQLQGGNFKTSPDVTLPAYDIVEWIAIVDVNYDAVDDVVMVNAGWQANSVIINNGNGTYQPYRVEAHNYYFSHIGGNGAAMTVEDGRVVLYVADYNHGVLRFEQAPPNPERSISVSLDSADGKTVDATFTMPVLRNKQMQPQANPPVGQLVTTVGHAQATEVFTSSLSLVDPDVDAAFQLQLSGQADADVHSITMEVKLQDGTTIARGSTAVFYMPVSGCETKIQRGFPQEFHVSEVWPARTNWGVYEDISQLTLKVPAGANASVQHVRVFPGQLTDPADEFVVHLVDCNRLGGPILPRMTYLPITTR